VPYTTVKAKKLPYVKYDLVGQLRGEAVIGALQNKDEKPAVVIATSINAVRNGTTLLQENLLKMQNLSEKQPLLNRESIICIML